MDEVWKEVIGFDGWYLVSNIGNVRSVDRNIADGRRIKGKMLKQFIDKDGYHKVTLHVNGKLFKKFVHRIVAEAFIPNPRNYPIINHVDENPENNSVLNLEWCTVKHNVNYGNRAQKFSEKTHGELNYGHKLTEKEVKNIRSEYKRGVKGHGTESLGKKYGVHRMTIKAIIERQSWKHI